MAPNGSTVDVTRDGGESLYGRPVLSRVAAADPARHPFVEAVDSAGMMAVSAGLLVVTAFVVRRRRPS
jgi:hypothetical protein